MAFRHSPHIRLLKLSTCLAGFAKVPHATAKRGLNPNTLTLGTRFSEVWGRRSLFTPRRSAESYLLAFLFLSMVVALATGDPHGICSWPFISFTSYIWLSDVRKNG